MQSILFLLLLLAIALSVIAWIDTRRQTIPNLLSLAVAMGGLAWVRVNDEAMLLPNLAAAVATAILLAGLRSSISPAAAAMDWAWVI